MHAAVRTPLLVAMTDPPDPRVDLVVFPGAGAGPSTFSGWRSALPDTWRLTSVCLPGRGARFGEPYSTSVHEVGAEVGAALNARAGAPLVLFGHSLGAILALETARHVTPTLVAVAGCPPPDPDVPVVYVEAPGEDVRSFTRALLLDLGVVEPDLLESLVDASAPALNADHAMLDGYLPPERPIGCPLVAYYGSTDDVPASPWAGFTSAETATVTIAGGHNFVRSATAQVIGHLSEYLDRLSPHPASGPHRQRPVGATARDATTHREDPER